MTHYFLRSLPAVAVIFLALHANAQTKGVAVNNDGRAPVPTAILDVSSNYLPLATAIQKGMLIPRLTYLQRTAGALGAVAGLPQGLTVFQTDVVAGFPAGFYVVEYGQWFRLDNGANSWSINGNNVGNPVNDFFGTRDNVDLVFRTNNLPVMRVQGTAATNYVHIGNNASPFNEQLDVEGAIRIFNPSPGFWNGTNPNTRFAATNTQGTILFRPSGTGAPGDSLQATFTPPGFASGYQNRDIVMWNGHWGNIDGTAPGNLAAADANAGGWTRMENEYEERFTRAYVQQGEPSCGPGTTELTFGSTLHSTAIAPVNAATSLRMNPFKYNAASGRWRCQYLFLKSELDVEANQLAGNTTATGGLCAGSAVTQIAFWLNEAIGANNAQRSLQVTVTLKHAPLGLSTLATFDNSVDPAAGCFTSAPIILWPTIAGAAGWFPINISPFIWDGQRNVILDFAVTAAAGGGGLRPGGIPIRYSNTGANLTYSAQTAPPYPAGPCSPLVSNSICNPAQVATQLGDCGVFGASVYRPVVRFGGQVTTAPAATSGQNAFIWYRGGLLAESTTTPTPWSRLGNPPATPFSFRGPGTISAENGVYDNQVKLNDHVFDRAFDGAVKPSDAADFGTFRHASIEEMADHTRQNRHLPTMKGRDSWKAEKGFSLGDLTNQLWTTSETQALYVSELNDRLNVLELLSTDRPLAPAEAEIAKHSIGVMQRRTDAEKALLLQTIDQRTVTTNNR